MKKLNTRRLNEIGFSLIYLVPTVSVFVFFCIVPTVRSLYMSFFDWSVFTNSGVFTGFENYFRMFEDEVVWAALMNNIYLLFWSTAITFVVSIYFAHIFTRKRYKENNFFRVLFFVPHVLSVTIVAILWSFLYNPSFGIINAVLSALNLEHLTQIWLGDKDVIMGAITAPLVWINIGFYMVLFVSAMANVSEDIYESADVDGATGMVKFFRITIPSIWETIRTSLAFFVITSFNYSFQLVYVMTKGGPNRASELLTTYLYEAAMKKSDYGYASAIGMLLFVITGLTVFLVLNLTRPKEEKYNVRQKKQKA